MKITTIIILAKRVYNLVARVVLETCKVGRPIYISMYIAMVSALTSLLLRHSAFRVLDCFSACLRVQEILLAINFQIRSTFNRK